MITLIFKACLMAIAAAAILGVSIVLIALIIYLVGGVVTSLIDTFKDVRARNRAKKLVAVFRKITATQATRENNENEKENNT